MTDDCERERQRNALRVKTTQLIARDRERVGRDASHLNAWLFQYEECRKKFLHLIKHITALIP